VNVHVDKSGRDNLPGRIHDLGSRGIRQWIDGDDLAIANSHVSRTRRGAGAIDYGTILNQQIEFHAGCS
jgi:hypothetical protein